mgnify:CR=1 FL=1|jgi:hypothetical protein
MEKVYEVVFQQRFNESRVVFAQSENDAEKKVQELWGDSVNADISFDDISMISENTDDYSETIDGGVSSKMNIGELVQGVKDVLAVIEDSSVGKLLSHNREIGA